MLRPWRTCNIMQTECKSQHEAKSYQHRVPIKNLPERPQEERRLHLTGIFQRPHIQKAACHTRPSSASGKERREGGPFPPLNWSLCDSYEGVSLVISSYYLSWEITRKHTYFFLAQFWLQCLQVKKALGTSRKIRWDVYLPNIQDTWDWPRAPYMLVLAG